MRRVAVTGFGVVSPIGVGREAFWEALRAGRSGIGRITRFDCDTFGVQLAGEVKEAIPLPGRVGSIAADDPKVGFAWAACAEAVASAGLARLGPRTLLHLGVSLEIFPPERIAFGGAPALPELLAGVLDASGREGHAFQIPLDTASRLIEESFGRAGQSIVNCSACAAGAQAIGHGFRCVRDERWDTAVCGGFDSMVNPLGVGGFQMLGALTTENSRGPSACRPFEASRSGTVLGEGAAVLVLEPLEDARADGKEILAEVCGYGSTMDAHGLSAPDPDGDGAARAMRDALDDARLPPEAIGHINAHGTGTQLNDEVEAAAIRRVFVGTWERIPISATKSVTGHLIAAAGAVEAGACLLSLTRGWIPPNPWLRNVAPGCELCHATGEAARFDGEYVLSNSFGFGGQNASLIFRRADGRY